MTEGVIRGGWEYVWAAYIVSAIFLGGYIGVVLARYRAELKKRFVT